ncbi:MAG TPA: class I SAM-dependent methyltransferase [Arcobacter sp.]|nr:class I SAM-dependent methyltransferase [Arcobacter sp.]HIP55641.1 class I SAM-dependent methyltransferase [Arcobacter sp.]
MEIKKDHFAFKANDYEKDVRRTGNVANIADGILKEFTFTKDQHIMDFGSGTGLLTQEIAPYVQKITCIDMSKSMTDVLREKSKDFTCQIEIKEVDITKIQIDDKYDAIISSMTIHHVKDIKILFKQFYSLLEVGGKIALADLEPEDGTFHSVDTGVFHFGFDKDWFLNIALEVGFKNLKIETVTVAKKPYGNFPIFLLTGNK